MLELWTTSTSELIAPTKGIVIINSNRDREIDRNHNDGTNGGKETGISGGGDRPPRGEETIEDQHAGVVESLVTSEVPAHTEGRPIRISDGNMRIDQADPGGKIKGGLNSDQVAKKNRK
jgi:hypothetical protein